MIERRWADRRHDEVLKRMAWLAREREQKRRNREVIAGYALGIAVIVAWILAR